MMRILLVLWSATFVASIPPPYSGTVWVSPSIVTQADPTAYVSHTYVGQMQKTMYDRRPPGWITVNAYVFKVSFDDRTSADFLVNPEFGSSSTAEVYVARYAPAIGQLSTSMRKEMREVWINAGDAPAGGGNQSILLHTEYADRHLEDGFLEEVLIHESGHTSFDAEHAQSAGWLAAQSADAAFISTYARDHPIREDISESLLMYYAYRHRPSGISRRDWDTIGATMPHRIAYFDGLNLDWHPMVTSTNIEPSESAIACTLEAYPNPFVDALVLDASCPAGYSILSLHMYDQIGRRIWRSQSDDTRTSRRFLNTEFLPAGRYVLTATLGSDQRVFNASILVVKR